MRHEHRPLPKKSGHVHGGAHAHGGDHGHGHGHVHSHIHGVDHLDAAAAHRPEEKKRLWRAIGVTTAAMVVETVGGILTGSLALVSDAGHMLTHSAALGVSLIAMVLATRPAAPERSFGLYRVEVLAALFNAVTLAAITFFIAREAWDRLWNPEPILAWQMFAVAVFGLGVNLFTAYILHGAGHDDLNFRSAFLHMIGDTLSSVAIVAGALVIRLTGWLWIDPVLSVLICVVILYWAWGLTRESIHILLESAPAHVRVDEVEREVLEHFPSVRKIDDIHLWTITSSMNAMTAYLEIDAAMTLTEQSDLAHTLRHFVHDEFHIGHAVFQFEPRSGDKTT